MIYTAGDMGTAMREQNLESLQEVDPHTKIRKEA